MARARRRKKKISLNVNYIYLFGLSWIELLTLPPDRAPARSLPLTRRGFPIMMPPGWPYAATGTGLAGAIGCATAVGCAVYMGCATAVGCAYMGCATAVG